MKNAKPNPIETDFDAFAREASSAAADQDIADGHWITFRTRDTPTGYVMRRYPDGRVERVLIELGPATVAGGE